MIMNSNYFDEDYFERGIETGKSGYQNYHWIPELTIPFTMAMIDYLGINRYDTVLDWGCAKGYTVKALRMLGRLSWGVDISPYALRNIDHEVEKYCCHVEFLMKYYFDFCIAKDVFEHIPIEQLKNTLNRIDAGKLFVIVPLGKDGKYNAHINNLDKSHIICKPSDWWVDFFEKNNWCVSSYTTHIDGIKESYRGIPEAHGFFTLRRKYC